MNPFRALFLSLSRMPPTLMLFVILGLAVVVTMFVMNILNERDDELKRIQAMNAAVHSAKEQVVYAAKNIQEGEMISQEALELRDVEKGRAPIDAFPNVNAVVGQQAAYPIPAGTVVSNHALRPINVTSDFGGRIPDGMRAITFGVDANSGVAGFIAPGNHVDVIAITGGGGDTKTAPVMSDVQVVAVGTTYQRAPGATAANPAGSVTVCVSPEDAIHLVKAVSAAKLYLSLRNDKDHAPIAVVDVQNLFPKHIDTSIAAAMPVTLLPPAPPSALSAEASGPAQAGSIAPPVPAPQHEIEMWQGSRRDVFSVPQG